MDKVLSKFWDIYCKDERKKSEAETKLDEKLQECENKLFKTMTPEQAELFCECEEYINNKNSLCERDAFIAGIRFSVDFFIEASKGSI